MPPATRPTGTAQYSSDQWRRPIRMDPLTENVGVAEKHFVNSIHKNAAVGRSSPCRPGPLLTPLFRDWSLLWLDPERLSNHWVN